jgi:hypothetical protein
MATDKSEPRIALILKVALFAVVLLVGVHAALTTYFDFALQGEELRKFGESKPVGLMSLREAEKERLGGGAMPIEKAMDELVRQGRKNAGSEFTPLPSKDLSALAGWSKMPAEVPTAMMIAASEDAGSPAAAGPAASTDAGAKPADAGAPKKKP